MKIIRVKGTRFYDIFLGEGWGNWSRVLVRNGVATTIKGQALHTLLLKEIVKNV